MPRFATTVLTDGRNRPTSYGRTFLVRNLDRPYRSNPPAVAVFTAERNRVFRSIRYY